MKYKNSYDIETYSMTIIPKSSDANHENFNTMARTIVKSAMTKVLEMDELTREQQTQQFLEILLISSDDKLKEFFSRY